MQLALFELKEAILEAVRSTKLTAAAAGAGPNHFPSGRFSLQKLSSIDDDERGLSSLNRYAEVHLERLGKGSSRAAYIYSSRAVLKVAFNFRGLMQNEEELSIYTDPMTKPIVTRIIDYDPKYRWLLSEPVRELDDPAEFTSKIGTLVGRFKMVIEWLAEKEFMLAHIADVYDNMTDYGRELAEACLALKNRHGLIPADLAKLGHWGVTADGRLVLLDYGWTEKVWNHLEFS